MYGVGGYKHDGGLVLRAESLAGDWESGQQRLMEGDKE